VHGVTTATPSENNMAIYALPVQVTVCGHNGRVKVMKTRPIAPSGTTRPIAPSGTTEERHRLTMIPKEMKVDHSLNFTSLLFLIKLSIGSLLNAVLGRGKYLSFSGV
jgi:hypothetical protein